MTHFPILLAFEQVPEDVNAAITAVMDRYDENREVAPYMDEDGEETTWNPEGRWDWWSIGGRWAGYFPGTEHARTLIQLAAVGNDGEGYPVGHGLHLAHLHGGGMPRLNAGPKRLLGIEEMRDEAGLKAEEAWNEYALIVFGTPQHLPWDHFVDKVEKAEQDRALETGETWQTFLDKKEVELKAVWGWNTEEEYQAFLEVANTDPEARKTFSAFNEARRNSGWREEWSKGLNYTLTQAREDYCDQPRIKRLREAEEYQLCWIMDGPEEEFEGHTRDEYIVRQRNGALPGYVFIGPDGLWRAPGEMGWFGLSTEEDGDMIAFRARVNEIVDAMDDNAYLVIVDAHV